MPIEIIYIIALIVLFWFLSTKLKRPIFESMFFCYVLMIGLTNEWKHFFDYIIKTSKDTLFYAIVAFMVLAQILERTHTVEKLVAFITALFGRIRGGAGYSAIVVSTVMGALSGSGAGNVAATGVFTIPAMKKTGFPSHLAANIEAASSTMGNMIPPSGVILAALACYNEYAGDALSQSKFWLVMWGVAFWFIIQRIITLMYFCKKYNVKPIAKEDMPSLRETFVSGWKSLLIPIIVIVPFVLDYLFKDGFFTERLGSGAKNMSSSLLLFVPGVAGLYALLSCDNKADIKEIPRAIAKNSKSIISVSATIYFAYCISNLFNATSVGKNIGNYIQNLNMNMIVLSFVLPLVCAILGMVLPGSAQTKIFGTTIIAVYAAAGGNPLKAAIMLPVITGAMEGITPPLALCTYTAIGIAKSDVKETLKNSIVWIGLHYIISVLVLSGILPVWGL